MVVPVAPFSAAERRLHDLLDAAWARRLDPHRDFEVPLRPGTIAQPGAFVAFVYPAKIWSTYSAQQKLRCLGKNAWCPTREELAAAAQNVFREEMFGGREDGGNLLMDLVGDHGSVPWDLSALTAEDLRRATAVTDASNATRRRLKEHEFQSPPRNLQLQLRAPWIAFLMLPMVVKVPVLSIRYYVDVHAAFAFSRIRRANHPLAGDLIAGLYDVLFLQQKIALGLAEFVTHVGKCLEEKKDSKFYVAEVDAIRVADGMFAYLKASIEKTMSLVAATYGIAGLDEKKTHKQKLRALEDGIYQAAKGTYYCELLLDLVSGKNLEELNRYRTGVLHKKGVSELQPHSFASVPAAELPLVKVYGVLYEQHAKNSIVLLSAFALLTDDLARRDPLTPVDVEHVPELAAWQGAAQGRRPWPPSQCDGSLELNCAVEGGGAESASQCASGTTI